MKRMLLAASLATVGLIPVAQSCSDDSGTVLPPKMMTTSGSTGGSGGASSTSASTSSTSSSTTGSGGNGGSATSTTSSTGSSGAGGATTSGVGGTGGSGDTGGAAGTGGTGGTTGAGGTGGGGAGGTGGTAGAGGTGGGGNGCLGKGADYSACFTAGTAKVYAGAAAQPMTDNAFEGLKSLDGSFNIDTGSTFSGSDGMQDYADMNPACQSSDSMGNQIPWKEIHWQFNGPGIVMGQTYQVSVRILGVVECKQYNNGAGPAKMDNNSTPSLTQLHNMWLTGANLSDNGDHWNTYAFTVSAAPTSAVVGIGKASAGTPPDAAHTYVFNQCPNGAIVDHYTWRLDGTQVITVKGGEWINYVEFDTNCRMIINCGTVNAINACPSDLNMLNKVAIPATVTPAAPAGLAITAQPPVSGTMKNVHGQWWFLDVTGIQ